jgi:phosphoadenosine phosphosulfate reductase
MDKQIQKPKRPSDEELKAISDSFETKHPQDVLAYALERYAPRIVLACSFGAEDVVLVDMVHRINPRIPLFYLDTDFLFKETYEVRDRILAKYGLLPDQVIQIKSLLTPEQQAARYGEAQWILGLDHRHPARPGPDPRQCRVGRMGQEIPIDQSQSAGKVDCV